MINTDLGGEFALRKACDLEVVLQDGHGSTMHHMHNNVKSGNSCRAFVYAMRVAHNVGMNLRTYRLAKGLSQEELGELVGLNQATIHRAEIMHTSAKLETYIKCAEALGIRLSDLFADDRSAEEALLVIAFRSSDLAKKKVLDALAQEAESRPPEREK